MPRRLDEVACPICMDSLFTKQNDLDEFIPISTPDCGHVFHHECIEAWFHSQSLQYVAMQREYGRELSPSKAPAECPTCRTECFADEETGQAILHRLYINFGGDGEGLVNSSPVGGTGSSHSRKRDREVMGLARRARDLGPKVKELNRGSKEDVFLDIVGKAQSLQDDLLSDKAIQAIKNYVGGLTTALNTLRAAVEANPLEHQYQNQIQGMRLQNIELAHQLRELQSNDIPREKQKAVQEERIKWERRVEKLKQEKTLIQNELNKEVVMRKALKRETEEKVQDSQQVIAGLRKQIMREEEERQDLSRQLEERTRQLQGMRAKADSRKALKNQLEEVQAENTKLRSDLTTSTSSKPTDVSSSSSSPPTKSRSYSKYFGLEPPTPDSDEEEISIQEITADVFAAESKRGKKRVSDTAELEIEDPSFASLSLALENSPGIGPSRRRANPTARTISSAEVKDIFASDDLSPKKRAKLRRRFRSESHDAQDENSRIRPIVDAEMIEDGPTGKGKIKVAGPGNKSTAPLSDMRKNLLALSKTSSGSGDWLHDANGRPRKGIVSGAPKVKRRA